MLAGHNLRIYAEKYSQQLNTLSDTEYAALAARDAGWWVKYGGYRGMYLIDQHRRDMGLKPKQVKPVVRRIPKGRSPTAAHKFVVPVKFNPADFPLLNGIEEFAYWWLSYIFYKSAYLKVGLHGWVPIDSRTISRWVTTDKSGRLHKAMIPAVIECDGFYEVGHRPKAYRIRPEYLGAWREVPVTRRKLIAEFEKHRLRLHGRPVAWSKLSPEHRHIYRYLARVRIYEEPARAVAMGMAHILRAKVAKSPADIRERRISDAEQQILDVDLAITEIANFRLGAKPYVSICEFGRRFHSVITRLPKELRQCLYFPRINDDLFIIDIVSSQVVFLLISIIQNRIQGMGEKKWEAGAVLPLSRAAPRLSFLPHDLARFIRWTAKGKVYQLLARCLSWRLPVGKRIDRDTAKKMLFCHTAYSDPLDGYVDRSRLTNLLRTKFPTIWNKINESKVCFEGGDDGAQPEHENLSREMQRAESDFCIGNVVGTLRTRFPKTPFLLVHDAFMLPERHVSEVVEVMEEMFASIGVDAANLLKILSAEDACKPKNTNAPPMAVDSPVKADIAA